MCTRGCLIAIGELVCAFICVRACARCDKVPIYELYLARKCKAHTPSSPSLLRCASPMLSPPYHSSRSETYTAHARAASQSRAISTTRAVASFQELRANAYARAVEMQTFAQRSRALCKSGARARRAQRDRISNGVDICTHTNTHTFIRRARACMLFVCFDFFRFECV